MKKENIRIFVVEAFGVFLLCTFGGLSTFSPKPIVEIEATQQSTPTMVQHLGKDIKVCFAHALAIYIGVLVAHPISGAHLNPAITLSLFFTYRIDKIKAAFYIAAQVAGSFIAAFLLLLLRIKTDNREIDGYKDWKKIGLGDPKLTTLEGNQYKIAFYYLCFIYEAVATMVLCIVVFALGVDQKRPTNEVALGVASGILIAGFSIGEFTGACLNPARVIGPSTLNGDQFRDGFWIYYLAPILGGLIGGFLYDFLILKSKEEMEEYEREIESYRRVRGGRATVRREIELSVTDNNDDLGGGD